MIGIIGGTGLYQMEGLSEARDQEVDTPFGTPSAPLAIGRVFGKPAVFLPRHGKAHGLLPSEINYRANIYALKSLGVTRVFAVSAVGSLSHEIAPGDLAVPSQYLDLTKGRRAHSFFGDGMVAHVSTAKPTCPDLAARIALASSTLDYKIHRDRTYACVEGPRLGTQAESGYLRKLDCHLVGMTNVPEAFLAREAQLCYCTIGVVTDYDCWLDDPAQHATVDKVIALYKRNLSRVQDILREILAGAAAESPAGPCGCRESLRHAVLTPEAAIPPSGRAILEVLRS